MNKRRQVIAALEHAFAKLPQPEEPIVVNLTHYEADDVVQDFSGKHWREITLEIAYRHRLSLPLFTPQAFRFYIPGLLIAALQAPFTSEYPTGEILEFIFFSLMPHTEHDVAKLLDIVNGFDTLQKASLEEFVRFIVKGNPYCKQLYNQHGHQVWNIEF